MEKSTQGPTAIESQRQGFTCYLFIFASFCKKITPSLKKRKKEKKNSELLQIGTELENLLVSTRKQAGMGEASARPFQIRLFTEVSLPHPHWPPGSSTSSLE